MKVIAGVHRPDTGQVFVEGAPVAVDSVDRATELGIAFIHQELNLADNLSIGANVFLGREPKRYPWAPFINSAEIHRQTRSLLEQLGLDLPPTKTVRELSIGQQQMVEIAKALSLDAKMIIMDEPTSSLTQHETERLFAVIRQLKSKGVCIAYISHRLAELTEIADRVTVLRDGVNSGELNRDEMEHERIVSLMVGRDVSEFYDHKPHEPGAPRLEVDGLVVPAHSDKAVSFAIRAGEIVGMAGLVGAGRTELARVLFGVDPALAGSVRVDGVELDLCGPKSAIEAGVALVPEDRKQQGLIVELGVKYNTVLAGLDRYQTGRFVQFGTLREVTSEMVQRLNIKTPTIEQEAQLLSGGNQQKVVLAKWLSLKPKVLLLDEPTRGIDVMAKQEIYALMEQMAREGVAILMISSEMEEVLGMSDRVLVMHEGEITGNVPRAELTEETIMAYATGTR